MPGYIESCVKYAVWNSLKKEQRRKQLFSEGNGAINVLTDSADVFKIVEMKVLGRDMVNLLAELSFKQRQAIVKTLVCGYSLLETANKLRVTPQAIFNLRKLGLRRLKKCLERIYISESDIQDTHNNL